MDEMIPAGTTRSVRTNCRACLSCCGAIVEVDEAGFVTAVRGDKEHPRSKGYLCPKGPQLAWGHNRPDRLNYPTVNGERVTWPALLDDLADKIKAAMDEHGPEAFGMYIGSGSDSIGLMIMFQLAAAMGVKQLYSPVTMDVAPSQRAAEFVTGFQELAPHWETEDADVRLILIFGSNPVVSHGYGGATGLNDVSRLWRTVQARGGKIWVFDPVATRSARLADEHVAPIPGADAVILAWLVRRALDHLPAGSPVEEATRKDDRDRLRAALAEFDLDVVATVAGVEPGVLERLWRDISEAGRIVFPAGTGMCFGKDGLLAEWLRWALLILTDSLERPGGMWFDPGWLIKLDERTDWNPAPEDGVQASGSTSRPDLRRFFGQTPLAALADEIENGPLRTLILFGASPITAVPDPERTKRALQSLDALAVIDVVPTENSDIATHVMPAASMLERADLNGLIASPFQPSLSPPVVPAGGERKDTWWILAQLAERLGIREAVFGARNLDALDIEYVVRRQISAARDSYDDLVAAGPHGLEREPPRAWALAGPIPGNRWRLAPPALVQRLSGLLTTGLDSNYPYRLICGRQERRYNRHDNVEKPKRGEAPFLHISRSDAGDLGLGDGAWAVVRSRHGRVRTQVKVSDAVRPGVVQLPHGWPDVNVTALLNNADIDPLTTQPQMSAISVALESV